MSSTKGGNMGGDNCFYPDQLISCFKGSPITINQTILRPTHRRGEMLSRGSKVIMKNGETLTVKSLEFNEFVPEERAEYVPKRDIKEVVGVKRPYAQPNAQRRSIYTDPATWEALLELGRKATGKRSASAGIREAVRISEDNL